MRVLHVISGLADGGAEATLFRLISASPSIEHEVISLTPGGRYLDELQGIGVKVTVLDLRSPFRSILRIFRLPRLVSDLDPDVIQSWMYHANLVTAMYGFFRKSPPIFWGIRHSDLVTGIDPWHTRVASWVCAKLSSSVPVGIVCAGHEAKRVHQKAGYTAEKLLVIPNGYDTERFAPNPLARDQLRKSLGISPNEFVIGVVARYTPQKDHRTLIDGLAKAKANGVDFRCLLVGNGMGPENIELFELAAQKGLAEQIMFLGPLTNIEKLLVSIDVLISASAFGEAFPNVIAEAMACGTPCIATDVGDSALIVGDSGLVIPPSSSEALAGAFLAVVEEFQNPSVWKERQKKSRERIGKNFDISTMSKTYCLCWEGQMPHSPTGD